jgi:hypothetical protein
MDLSNALEPGRSSVWMSGEELLLDELENMNKDAACLKIIGDGLKLIISHIRVGFAIPGLIFTHVRDFVARLRPVVAGLGLLKFTLDPRLSIRVLPTCKRMIEHCLSIV